MMEGRAEKLIYVKADKTFEKLRSAIAIFEEYLQKADLSSLPLYYRARNDLEEAEASFQSQQEGKRKLANIKIRMILDKLKALLLKAQGLRERALKTQQKSL